jgi:molecular chaperone GrpE (heat shock protein)
MKKKMIVENATPVEVDIINDYVIPGMRSVLAEEINKINQLKSYVEALSQRVERLQADLESFRGMAGREIVDRIMKGEDK